MDINPIHHPRNINVCFKFHVIVQLLLSDILLWTNILHHYDDGSLVSRWKLTSQYFDLWTPSE